MSKNGSSGRKQLRQPDRSGFWKYFGLAVLAVATVGLVFFAVTNSPGSSAVVGAPAPTTAATTGTSGASPTSSASTEPADPTGSTSFTVLGDSMSAGTTESGNWPALVGKQLNVAYASGATAGAGYTVEGNSFADQLSKIGSRDTTIFIVGGKDDADHVSGVRAATKSLIAKVKKAAPNAGIVVVGPIWGDSKVPSKVIQVNNKVKAAATAAGVTFVDVLSKKWLSDAGSTALDTGLPTKQGQEELASQFAGLVAANLAAG